MTNSDDVGSAVSIKTAHGAALYQLPAPLSCYDAVPHHGATPHIIFVFTYMEGWPRAWSRVMLINF